MSEPFLSEIRMVGFNFAPRGWAFCDGQMLPINQNQTLFALLGTIYGGDGRTSFALPDLRGRAPSHRGEYYPLGHMSGTENVTVNTDELPSHTHSFSPSSAPGIKNHIGKTDNTRTFGTTSVPQNYGPPTNMTTMGQHLDNTGGGQPHNNMQPTLTIAFCIAMQGLFPSRN